MDSLKTLDPLLTMELSPLFHMESNENNGTKGYPP